MNVYLCLHPGKLKGERLAGDKKSRMKQNDKILSGNVDAPKYDGIFLTFIELLEIIKKT